MIRSINITIPVAASMLLAGCQLIYPFDEGDGNAGGMNSGGAHAGTSGKTGERSGGGTHANGGSSGSPNAAGTANDGVAGSAGSTPTHSAAGTAGTTTTPIGNGGVAGMSSSLAIQAGTTSGGNSSGGATSSAGTFTTAGQPTHVANGGTASTGTAGASVTSSSGAAGSDFGFGGTASAGTAGDDGYAGAAGYPSYPMDRIYDPSNSLVGTPCIRRNGILGTMVSKCDTVPSSCGNLYCIANDAGTG